MTWLHTVQLSCDEEFASSLGPQDFSGHLTTMFVLHRFVLATKGEVCDHSLDHPVYERSKLVSLV